MGVSRGKITINIVGRDKMLFFLFVLICMLIIRPTMFIVMIILVFGATFGIMMRDDKKKRDKYKKNGNW